MECGGALDASCGGGTVHAAEGDALGVCSTNGLDGDNGKHDAGSGGILAMGESNRALHADDNSGALCTDSVSNVPSGGNNATVLKGAGSSNVLAAGEGDGTLHGDDDSGAPRAYIGIDMLEQRWRRHLDARIPGSDLVVGGALNAGYRRTCGLGKGILAGSDSSLGEGGGQPRQGWVRRMRPQRRPHVSGWHGRLYKRPRQGQT
jgi:hypothetical protein